MHCIKFQTIHCVINITNVITNPKNVSQNQVILGYFLGSISCKNFHELNVYVRIGDT